MLINALVEYVERRPRLLDQLDDIAFQDYERKVRWAIEIDLNGRFVGVRERLTTEEKKGKQVTVPKLLRGCNPWMPRNHGTCPLLGCDLLDYVFGPTKDTAEGKEDIAERKHAEFLALHDGAANSGVPALVACAAFLNSKKELGRARKALSGKADSGSWIAFQMGDQPVIELSDVRHWWAGYYEARKADYIDAKGGRGRCMYTGEMGPIEMVHSPVKVPGGTKYGSNPNGARLISFYKPAFQHYGWEQGFNCPMSPRIAAMVRIALQDLSRYEERENVRTRFNLKNHVCLYWTQTPGTEDFGDYLHGNEEAVERLDEAPRRSDNPSVSDWQGGNIFYVLILGFNNSRMHVKYFGYALTEQVRENLYQWFKALEVPDYFDEARTAKPPGLRSLVRAAFSTRDDVSLGRGRKAQFEEALLKRALFGHGVPHNGVKLVTNQIIRAKKGSRLRSTRFALLKLFLGEENYKMAERTLPGRLGRVLAWAHNLQASAAYNSGQRQPTRKVGDAMFSPMKQHPDRALSRLTTKMQAHLAKLGRYRPKIRELYEEELGAFLREVEDLGPVPARFNSTQGCQFSVGYYVGLSEKKEIIRKAREAREADDATANAAD